jgi:hypothetical protein
MLEAEISFKFKIGAGDHSLALWDDTMVISIWERSGDSRKEKVICESPLLNLYHI